MEFNIVLCLVLLALVFISSRSVFLAYCTLSCLICSYFPLVLNPWFSEVKEGQLLIASSCSRTLFYLIIIAYSSATMYKVDFRKILVFLAAVNVPLIVYHRLVGMSPWGICLTSTMDGTYLAMMIPFVWDKVWLRVLLLVGVVATGSSIGIVGALISIFIMSEFSYSLKSWFTLVCSLFFYALDKHFVSDSLRFVCWQWSFEWWFKQGWMTKVFGTGLGSYQVLGPYIQQVDGKNLTNGFYTFMHSSILQSLFELGVVGFILLLLLVVSTIVKCKKSKENVALIAVCVFASLFNMSTSYPLTCIALIFIFRTLNEHSTRD